MKYAIVDKRKYANLFRFSVLTYIMRTGVSARASVLAYMIIFFIPSLILFYSQLPDVDKKIGYGLLGLLFFSQVVSSILIYFQKFEVSRGSIRVELFGFLLREISLSEITSIRRIQRWGGAIELRWNNGTRMMCLFMDNLPMELARLPNVVQVS